MFGGAGERRDHHDQPGLDAGRVGDRPDYAGAQIGVDFGCFNVGGGGAAINVGLLAGINIGKSKQDQPVPPTGARLISENEFNSRYFGIYATYLKGNFFGDIQVIHDQTDYEINSFAIVGGNPVPFVTNQTPESQRLTVSGSAGYAFTAYDLPWCPRSASPIRARRLTR